jgi:spore coat assembly protein
MVVRNLIRKYNPDVLVITGHDGMIKNGTGYTDIYNYRNSRYFISTVKEARRAMNGKKLVIFAGACQSFFEALMDSGANYASSPSRILIDFMDPLLIAEKVAITPEDKKIEMREISNLLKDDFQRVGGITTRGKRKKYTF